MFSSPLRSFTLLLLGSLFSVCAAAGDVSIEKASVHETAPGQPNAAAYLTLVNHGAVPYTLISASSDVSDSVEFHEHLTEKGVMQMRQVFDIAIPAASTVTFEPGGHHIMLIGLAKPLVKGESVMLMLQFQEGNSVTILVPVTAILP